MVPITKEDRAAIVAAIVRAPQCLPLLKLLAVLVARDGGGRSREHIPTGFSKATVLDIARMFGLDPKPFDAFAPDATDKAMLACWVAAATEALRQPDFKKAVDEVVDMLRRALGGGGSLAGQLQRLNTRLETRYAGRRAAAAATTMLRRLAPRLPPAPHLTAPLPQARSGSARWKRRLGAWRSLTLRRG